MEIMKGDNSMLDDTATDPQQATLDLLESKRKEFDGSLWKWLQSRRENEPGYTETVEYNPVLVQIDKKN